MVDFPYGAIFLWGDISMGRVQRGWLGRWIRVIGSNSIFRVVAGLERLLSLRRGDPERLLCFRYAHAVVI